MESKIRETLSRFSLEDRMAIVTGAGGIGKGIALGFARAGAYVVIAEIDSPRGEATAEKIRALGRKALAIECDVTKADQVQSMVDKTLAEFGRIDILVNNVGGVGSRNAPFLEMPEEMWDAVINRTLKSTFLCSQFTGKVMREQKKGNMINIGSSASEHGFLAMVAHGTSKAG